MTSYSEIVEKIFSLQTRIRGKLHLEEMRKLCDLLGNPQNNFKSIHIAGTNGKGSVSTMIACGLEAAYGGRIGLYTSPHICTFRERIRINQQMISEKEITRILSYVVSISEKEDLSASFFELTTAAAFLFFAENNVSYASIEAGLGGRHDATNLLMPVLSIITSISLEHTELLGDTIEAIAYEKAGIIKEGVPVIIGPTVPYAIVGPIARSLKAPTIRISISGEDYREENRQIAIKGLELLGIDKSSVNISSLKPPPCRFEKHTAEINTPVIFDVAHNPAGMEKLVELLDDEFPRHRFNIILAISKTKELRKCLLPLLPLAAHWYPVEAPNGRSYPAKTLANVLRELGVQQKSITLSNSVREAYELAYKNASPHLGLLVCGTFFIMSEARKAFGIEDPTDPFDLNEKAMPQALTPKTTT